MKSIDLYNRATSRRDKSICGNELLKQEERENKSFEKTIFD